MGYVMVFIGAGLGRTLRHATNVLATRLFGLAFPVGTLAVNILSAFATAVVVEVLARKEGMPQSARLFFTTGVLGGFSTFSTFTSMPSAFTSGARAGRPWRTSSYPRWAHW